MTKAIANQAVEGTAPHWVRMNLSSDGFPAASLSNPDVNVYSVSMSILFCGTKISKKHNLDYTLEKQLHHTGTASLILVA